VMSVSNGTSALIYVDPNHVAMQPALRDFFASRDWVGALFGPDDLAQIGQKPEGGLTFAVSMAASEEPNAFGVPGSSLAAKPAMGKPDRLGCGQHGGLGRYEQAPFLMASGPSFRPGTIRKEPARIVDIAPTALRHLGLDATGMDGAPLQHPDAAADMEETRWAASR